MRPDSSNPIVQWPLGERPRERLLAQGAAALSDAELLAVLLRTGIAGLGAVALARQLLQKFGSLGHLLARPALEACREPGLGPAKWAQLQAAHELARRIMAEPLRKTTALGNPEQASDYLRLWLRDKPHEVFVVLLLDSQLRLMQSQELFRGTVSQAAVYPREVVRQAMQCNASAVIVAHNHPSGVAEPSAGDLSLTRSLAQALALLDIRLLDHLIVAGPQVVSLAQRGLL